MLVVTIALERFSVFRNPYFFRPQHMTNILFGVRLPFLLFTRSL